jgi:purine-binding chemotaxis protein CheW
MVNLAKLRKKANEKKEEGREAAAAATPVEQASAPEATPPAPAVRAKKKGGKVAEPEVAAAADPEQRKGSSATPEQGKGSSGPEADEPTAAQVSKLEAFKATAGQAKEFARSTFASGVVDEGERVELLMFSMAGEQYAIDIERIAEIINPRKPTPVPNAPPVVVGIISLRGTIVTMLDLRRELGHDSSYTAGPETRTIVVEDRGGLAGFVVDKVLRVVKVAVSEIQSHPVVSLAEQRDAIRGVFHHGSALTVILDIEKLLGASD